MKKLLLISLFTFLFFCISLPAFSQTNVNTDVGVTFGLGAVDTASHIIDVVQWAIEMIGLISIILVIYSYIMRIVWQTRLKNFDTEHNLTNQQDYTKLNANDTQQRSAIKKKIKIYRIIIVIGVFTMIIMFLLWPIFIFRAE